MRHFKGKPLTSTLLPRNTRSRRRGAKVGRARDETREVTHLGCRPVGLGLFGGAAGADKAVSEPESPEQIVWWTKDLESADSAGKVKAAESLGEARPGGGICGSGPGPFAAWREPRCSSFGGEGVGRIGVADRAVSDGLLGVLEDDRLTSDGEPVWFPAALAISELKPNVVPELISLLANDRSHVRRGAAIALGGFGPDAQAAVPALVRLMEKDEADLRYAAMYALMGVGPSASAAVPALVKMLSHDDFHTQYWSCRALGRIGAPAARPAVPTLIVLVRTGVASVRRNAAAALGEIGPQAVPRSLRLWSSF